MANHMCGRPGGQPLGVSSPFIMCVPRIGSGHEAWCQTPGITESSCHPKLSDLKVSQSGLHLLKILSPPRSTILENRPLTHGAWGPFTILILSTAASQVSSQLGNGLLPLFAIALTGNKRHCLHFPLLSCFTLPMVKVLLTGLGRGWLLEESEP